MTGFARRCWTCHTSYSLEQFRELPKPAAGERQEVTGQQALILRMCRNCNNALALPESEVYPPDTTADVVSLAAVRDAKAQADKPRINVGTGIDENQGRVWLTGEGDVKGWDVINDRLGWWLSPENADALAGMLRGAAAKARGIQYGVPQGVPAQVPAPTTGGPLGLIRLRGQAQYFKFKEPIPMPGPEGHTVRFNPETSECEVVEPEPEEEP